MVIPHLQRTHDCKMQSVQKTYVASTTLMLKAVSKLTKLLSKHNNVDHDIKAPSRYLNMNNPSPILQQNPTTHIYTDASSYGWGASCNSETCGGQLSTTERKLHINILELKAALFGLESFCKEASNQHILIYIDNK